MALIWVGHALRSSIVRPAGGLLHLIYKGIGEMGQTVRAQEAAGARRTSGTPRSTDAAGLPRRLVPDRQITRSAVGYFSDVAVDSRASFTRSGPRAARRVGHLLRPLGRRRHLVGADRPGRRRIRLVVPGPAQDRRPRPPPRRVGGGRREPGHGLRRFGATDAAKYAVSTDGGQSWSMSRFPDLRVPVRSPKDEALGPRPQQPALGIDGRGTILFVFREAGTDRILYRRSADGISWSVPAALPGIGAGVARPYDVYDMVTDRPAACPSGRHRLPQRRASTMALLHLEWDGVRWGSRR